jgi:hypothetical protein
MLLDVLNILSKNPRLLAARMLSSNDGMATKIVAREFKKEIPQFLLEPENSFTRQPRFEEALKCSLTDKLCGVKVLCAGAGLGKSTYTRHVLQDLIRDGKIKGGKVIDNYGDILLEKTSPFQWLKTKFNIPSAQENFTEYCDSKPSEPAYVLVFDQFESVADKKGMKEFITLLAAESQKTKTLQVLLNIRVENVADTVLSWNGNDKITQLCNPNLLSWKKEELRELSSKLSWDGWEEGDKKRAIDILVDCGYPAGVINVERNPSRYAKCTAAMEKIRDQSSDIS